MGLLVDRAGFPLQVGCWEGNKAEASTIVPIVEAFQAAHGIEELVVVADAGMLSAANLAALDEARLRFIVGARTTRAPGDLEAHFRWEGDAFTDGQVIDTITPQKRLEHRAGQEFQGRASVGPGRLTRVRGGRYGSAPRSVRLGTARP